MQFAGCISFCSFIDTKTGDCSPQEFAKKQNFWKYLWEKIVWSFALEMNIETLGK